MLFRRVCCKLRKFGHREGNVGSGSEHEIKQGTNYGLEPSSYLQIRVLIQRLCWHVSGRERGSGSLGVLHSTTLQYRLKICLLINMDHLAFTGYAHSEELRQLP